MKRLGLFLVLILSVSACTKKAGKLEYGLDPKETLRINLEQEPPTLDLSKSKDTTSSLIEMNIMEGLAEYDLKDPNLNLIPALATEWTSTNNAKSWTISLRKGVKWTDGVEFTAQHVVDGWERLLNPATASDYAYFLFNVKNAQSYNQGKIKDFKQVGVSVNGEGQLVIELNSPMSYFPYLFTHHSTWPIRVDVIKKFGDKWTEAGNMVTLGAYKLAKWEHDKNILLERNDDYYGEKAKTKYILGYFINEYSTALNLFSSGKLDFQKSLPAKELSQYKDLPGYRANLLLQMYYYGFNTKKPPFNDLKVRKAFAHAIDRKQIVDLLNAGHKPLSGWVPESMKGHNNSSGIQFDPARAAKLLDEAGFKDRGKLAKVTLGFNTNENHQRIAENVQAQLKKNLGVDIQIMNEEWKTYLDRLKTDAPNIYRMGWLADYPDPDNFYNLMTSYSANNHTGWGNPAYDKLVEEGAGVTDEAKRHEIYAKAQVILTETDVPVVPLFTSAGQFLISDRVHNFPSTALDRFIFKGVTLK